jgi:hypothetical protein
MIVKLDSDDWSGDSRLLCSSCGEQYLHHTRVEVCEMLHGEDGDVLRTAVDTGRTTVEKMGRNESGNPSARRDGLRVFFWCEICPALPVLCLAQHKGFSLVWWQFLPGEKSRPTEPDGEFPSSPNKMSDEVRTKSCRAQALRELYAVVRDLEGRSGVDLIPVRVAVLDELVRTGSRLPNEVNDHD